ncbi:hypothetical protein Tco_0705311 [Tanacetum coccineum]|uniref:Uncharacterized protein n=1 Tax=Tanacetum coccineum TaxID=301880 RepID=A0ABQ4Y537_9ASTR
MPKTLLLTASQYANNSLSLPSGNGKDILHFLTFASTAEQLLLVYRTHSKTNLLPGPKNDESPVGDLRDDSAESLIGFNLG